MPERKRPRPEYGRGLLRFNTDKIYPVTLFIINY